MGTHSTNFNEITEKSIQNTVDVISEFTVFSSLTVVNTINNIKNKFEVHYLLIKNYLYIIPFHKY